MDDTKPFPIQAGESYRESFPLQGDEPHKGSGRMIYPQPSTIPWWLAKIAYKYYSDEHGIGQSLERLAERGGFGRQELLYYLRKGKWK